MKTMLMVIMLLSYIASLTGLGQAAQGKWYGILLCAAAGGVLFGAVGFLLQHFQYP